MLLEARYCHIPELGNKNYKTHGAIEIADMEKGISIMEIFIHRAQIILMCGCKDFSLCHRNVVAQELKRRGYEVEEINDWRMKYAG